MSIVLQCEFDGISSSKGSGSIIRQKLIPQKYLFTKKKGKHESISARNVSEFID